MSKNKKLYDGTEVSENTPTKEIIFEGEKAFCLIDTPTRSTTEGRVLLTADQISAKEAQNAATESKRAMRDWKRDMEDFDKDGMNRDLENVISVLSPAQMDDLDSITKQKYLDKIKRRSEKP